MGIHNDPPGSFTGAGGYFDPDAALRHGLEMVEQGADLLDVGGESTRPGSDPVTANEEWRRIGPVIHDLANKEIDRKSTRLNSSHGYISYAVFCLKKKKKVLIN